MKTFFIVCSLFFLTSCTIYTEKQSEALSRSVYASKDSIENARFDLADLYVNESSRLVKPPKKRIEIKPVFKKNIDIVTTQHKTTPTVINKQRVVIIPEKYKSDTVVIVSSSEYEQLLKDKEVYSQIEKDLNNLSETKIFIDQELIKQMQYNDKMVKDLNIMQKKLVEKDLVILQRNIVIVLLISLIVGGVYLRIKGIL